MVFEGDMRSITHHPSQHFFLALEVYTINALYSYKNGLSMVINVKTTKHGTLLFGLASLADRLTYRPIQVLFRPMLLKAPRESTHGIRPM